MFTYTISIYWQLNYLRCTLLAARNRLMSKIEIAIIVGQI